MNKIRRKMKIATRMSAFIAAQKKDRTVPMNEKRVLFISDVRDEIGGNLGEIYNALDKNEWDCDIYCKDKQLHPQTIKNAREISRKLSEAKYILLEDVLDYLEFYVPRDGQKLIQLWHAEGAYKKFGFSREEEGLRVSKGHRKYTDAIVSAEKIRPCYAEAFGISVDKVVASGVPRTDILFDEKWKAEVRSSFLNKYPQAEGKKIVLFAPTYRGTTIREAGYDMSKLPWDYFRKELGEDYVFITKWHPAIYNNLKLAGTLPENTNFCIDLSGTRDVNDILPVADIMITDYSSVIFDWLLLDRPLVYYAYDLKEYEDGRGLYYPFEDYLYGTVARTPEELVKAIRTGDMMNEKRKSFREKFMSACDGHATERTIGLIIK